MMDARRVVRKRKFAVCALLLLCGFRSLFLPPAATTLPYPQPTRDAAHTAWCESACSLSLGQQSMAGGQACNASAGVTR